jgi:hypothetical protein
VAFGTRGCNALSRLVKERVVSSESPGMEPVPNGAGVAGVGTGVAGAGATGAGAGAAGSGATGAAGSAAVAPGWLNPSRDANI